MMLVLEGSEKASVGYHGYNGHTYGNGAMRQKYGPKYDTGDVIGCCVNTMSRSCFFTYNGIHLGTVITLYDSILDVV